MPTGRNLQPRAQTDPALLERRFEDSHGVQLADRAAFE